MAEYKYLNNEVKTKLNDVSKKIVKVKSMKDEDIIATGGALEASVKAFTKEQKEVLGVFNKLINILVAEKERRGIEKLHKNQLSLFDTTTALENKEDKDE